MHDDVVLFAFFNIGGNTTRAHHAFQRTPDIGHRYAQIRSALAIDVDTQLWTGFLVIRIGAHELLILFHFFHQGIAPLHDLFVVRAANNNLQSTASATGQPGSNDGACNDARNLVEGFPDLFNDCLCIDIAFFPRLQNDDSLPGMHLFAGSKTTGDAGIDSHYRTFIAGDIENFFLDLLHLRHGVIEAGAFGPGYRNKKCTAIFRRRQFTRNEIRGNKRERYRRQHGCRN